MEEKHLRPICFVSTLRSQESIHAEPSPIMKKIASGELSIHFYNVWNEVFKQYDEVPIEEKFGAFLERWGSCDTDTLTQVLQKGNADERLFSIFALGIQAPENIQALLTPFLSSTEDKERWASAMALGDLLDESVFTLLQDLLLEKLVVPPNSVINNIAHVVRATKRGVDWKTLVEPEIVAAFYQELRDETEFTWYQLHRFRLVRILGDWGDPRAIPALLRTLQTCLAFDHREGGAFGNPHEFQDELAYALGQLNAWNILNELNHLHLSPVHIHLLRIYLVFGALQAERLCVFDPVFCTSDIREYWQWHRTQSLYDRTPPDPRCVTEILLKQFGFTEEMCHNYFQHLPAWYTKRNQYRLC